MKNTRDLDADLAVYVRRRYPGGSEEKLLPLMTGLHYYIFLYVFPFQFLLGVVGNILNLSVLLSRNMRSEANILLSVMAICDILLLFSMLPNTLGVIPFFYQINMFRRMYYMTQFFQLFLSNFFSCITSWLILAVSVERYMGVRSPIQFRCQWRTSRVLAVIFVIVIGSYMLTFYHCFEYKHAFTYIANGTKLYASPVNVNVLVDVEQWVKSTIRIFKILQIILSVFLPTFGIAVLNLKIISVLRKSKYMKPRLKDNSKEDPVTVRCIQCYSDLDGRRKRDLKVTFTVLAIISCYLITHVPSTIPFAVEIIYDKPPMWILVHVVPLLHTWLITGKVANFVLFCMSSVYFRRRLMALLRERLRLSIFQKKPNEKRTFGA